MCCAQSRTATGFRRSKFIFPVSAIPPAPVVTFNLCHRGSSLNNRQLRQVKHFLILMISFLHRRSKCERILQRRLTFIQSVLEPLINVHLRSFVFFVLLHSADCATHHESVCLSACLPARLHRYFDKVVKAGTPA